MSAAQQMLFRPESLRARQLAWLGTPSLSLPLPTTVVTVVMLLLVAGAGALIVLGSYARRVNLHGLVLPQSGLIKVTAPAAGWIQSINVVDGEDVNEGVLLYRVNVDTTTKAGATQQMIIAALHAERTVLDDEIDRKNRIRDAEERALALKIDNLKSQISQAGTQIATQDEFEQTLHSEYQRLSELLSRGMSTRNELDLREQRWMAAKSQLEELRSALLRLRAQLTDAEHQLATNALHAGNEIDSLRGQISRIDQEIARSEAQRSIEIRAPAGGIVTAVLGHPGQLVGAGAAMLTIVPHQATMQAELLAPSSAIGFVHQGERVLLRYSAFPYQKFGQYWGTVTDVSHAALPQEELKTLAADTSHQPESATMYRVTVRPDGQELVIYGHPERLTASMEVEALVLLDARPLYQWILEPLYVLRQRFQAN